MSHLSSDLTAIAKVLYEDLRGAEAIGVLPASYGSTEREGYSERAYAVAWRRALRENQPDQSGDGYTYATHRVHVNSDGKEAAFEGHYDMTRAEALTDMLERAEHIWRKGTVVR